VLLAHKLGDWQAASAIPAAKPCPYPVVLGSNPSRP